MQNMQMSPCIHSITAGSPIGLPDPLGQLYCNKRCTMASGHTGLIQPYSARYKKVCSERQQFHSKIINKNNKNPRIFFSIIYHLLNNKPYNWLDQPSVTMCEDFRLLHVSKIPFGLCLI